MISAPEIPSISAWWIFVSIAMCPDPSPEIRYSSQSGLARSSGREVIRATCSASWGSLPGAGSASSRTWKSRSKSISSTQ